jgi:hypothetical protein
MKTTRYPAITDFSLAVILAAEPSAEITPELVETTFARPGDLAAKGLPFEAIVADLDRAHMIDENRRLTPLADRYAAMWQRFLATKDASP